MNYLGMASALAASAMLTSTALHAQSNTLTTTFAGGNNANGNAFDIRVGGSNITLTDVVINLVDSSETVNFWYRPGTYNGNLGSSAGWTRLDRAVLTANNGISGVTDWNVPDQVFEANTTYGIVIVVNGFLDSELLYTNSPSVAGTEAVSDANLTIEHGVGLSPNDTGPDGFNWGTFSPRTWNGSFIYILGTPAIDALIAASGTSARLVVVGADGVARDAGQVSIATRNGQTTFTRVADGTGAGDVTISTSGAPGMMGNLYTWVEVTGFRSDEFGATNTGTIGGNGLQIGADMEIGSDMIAGLSFGYSTVNAVDGATTTEGTYTYLQPYFAYRSGAWSGSASLVYGMGSFEQNGAANTADVTLAAVTFEGGYDYALNDAFTLTPTLGLMHGREEIEGTGGSLAGTSSDVTFSQFSLGGRISHDSAEGTLFAGLHADYLTNETESVLAQDMLANDGWTGRVELGGEMALSNGMDLSTSVELSGLGGDMQTLSGALRVALRF